MKKRGEGKVNISITKYNRGTRPRGGGESSGWVTGGRRAWLYRRNGGEVGKNTVNNRQNGQNKQSPGAVQGGAGESGVENYKLVHTIITIMTENQNRGERVEWDGGKAAFHGVNA